MDPVRYQHIKAILADVLDLPPDERARTLTARCGADAELRAEIESLLAHESGDDFLVPGRAREQYLNEPPTMQNPVRFGDPSNTPAREASPFLEDLAGRRLGQFRVVSLLGEGGMARVYKGYQESVDRFVALKLLPRQYATDPEFLERFRQEARIVASLQHPHILSVFDHGESEGYAFLAMPLIESGTLADVLSRGRLSFFDVERIITQVCEAVDHAHSKGIIHRDIKPSNILMDSEGNAFVADFGIAKLLSSAGHLTRTGLFLGSPTYMSPEQMTGGDVGPHSDLFSVGMVLYEMLAGTVPFKGEGPLVSLSRFLNEPLPSPKLQNPEITPELEAVVLKALARSKADRFSSGKTLAAAVSAAVRAFGLQRTATVPPGGVVFSTSEPAVTAAIQRATSGQATEVMSSTGRPRVATRVSWAAGGLAVLALAILSVWMLRNPDRQPPAPAREPVAEAPIVPPPAPAGEPVTQEPTRSAPPPSAAAPSSRDAAPSRPTLSPSTGSVPGTPRSETLTAKQMYAASTPGGPVNPGLKYRLIESRGRTGEIDADPARTFHSGERVRFGFESNIDGYLYVVQRGSTGQWTVLFPDPDANGGRNAIRPSEEYFVPNNGWFAFDDTPGTEEVFVILSKQPLDTLPGFEAPVTRRESVDTSVVAGLRGSIQTRDLVFEKERPAVVDGRTRLATFVVNRAELAGRVAAFIPLTHAK